MPTTGNLLITSNQTQLADRLVRRPHSRITRIEKIQRAFRILGRIYNPLNDAATGALFASSFICPIYECGSSLAVVVPISISSLAFMLPSAAYEMYSSMKLSKESPFVYGQSDTHQLIILQDKLSIIIGPEVASYSLVELLNLRHHPDYGHNHELARLVQDFKRVRLYNYFRKLSEILNTALLSEGTLNYLLVSYFLVGDTALNNKKLFDFTGVAITFPAIVIFFIFKSMFHHIEYQWEYYEVLWKKLPLCLKKALVGLREIIDTCYDLIFALNRVGLGLSGAAMTSLLYAHLNSGWGRYKDCDPLLVWDAIMNRNFLKTLFFPIYGAPAIASYVVMQRIPSHKPVCDKRIIHGIKRFNQALTTGTGIGGALLFPLAIIYFLVLSSLENCGVASGTILITFILAAALGGMTTAINTLVNYQERDSKKLTVMDNEVQTLRQALLNEERALIFPLSYGAIESETQPSSSRTPTLAVKEPKTKAWDTYSWLSFWRPSDRKGRAVAQPSDALTLSRTELEVAHMLTRSYL
jgi:hypothetical protein